MTPRSTWLTVGKTASVCVRCFELACLLTGRTTEPNRETLSSRLCVFRVTSLTPPLSKRLQGTCQRVHAQPETLVKTRGRKRRGSSFHLSSSDTAAAGNRWSGILRQINNQGSSPARHRQLLRLSVSCALCCFQVRWGAGPRLCFFSGNLSSRN